MASPRTSPLPKTPLVVAAGVALVVVSTAMACGDDTGGEGGSPPGISEGGSPGLGGEGPIGGSPPGAGAPPEGGAPGIGGAPEGGGENAGGAPGLAGGAGG